MKEFHMSIITISRGSHSRGKEVAEKWAAKLNCECVSRDILLEACAEFNIAEIKAALISNVSEDLNSDHDI